MKLPPRGATRGLIRMNTTTKITTPDTHAALAYAESLPPGRGLRYLERLLKFRIAHEVHASDVIYWKAMTAALLRRRREERRNAYLP